MKKNVFMLAIAAVTTMPFIVEARDGHMGQNRQARFAEMDADQDGKVTQDEFQAYRAAQVAAIDADGDGFLTEGEIKAHFLTRSNEKVEDRVERMMTRIDVNQDGKIDAAEVVLGMHQPTGVGMMFQRADKDEDGAVSQEEFQAMRAPRRMRGERAGRGRYGERHGQERRGRHRHDD